MVFDAETKCTIHAEMAKKNLFVKRGVGADFSSFDQSKRLRTGGDFAHSGFQSPPFHPQPVAVWATPGYMAPPAPYDPFGGYLVPQVAIPSLAPVPALSGYAPVQSAKDNPPCNTLFEGNLGENVVEEELKGLFSIQPGYKQMKILRQEGIQFALLSLMMWLVLPLFTPIYRVLFCPVLVVVVSGYSFQKIPLGDEKTQLMVLLLRQMELQQHISSKTRRTAYLLFVLSPEG